jgi:hypothetical protein
LNAMNKLQVHRFRGKVAVYVGGDTVYLPFSAAIELAEAIIQCAADVTTREFKDSRFDAREIDTTA